MRLVDFSFATADYDLNRPLFIYDGTNPQPVTGIEIDSATHRLQLRVGTNYPITLDQFNTRTKRIPGHWRIVMLPTNRELFGYRLIGEKLVFM
ncbi:hypothetical protein [Furfurilactobacillus curtus]|uniref:Uncharacterized protein n=1 Tax=Furfurilactobacillus curtus TaxID=1746200 RepID=A0ABQ5JNP2_9LACO